MSALGGSDNIGCYVFSDTVAPLDGNAPTFSWVDISATGTRLFLSDDEVSAAVPIGFYQNSYAQAFISSNGFITFLDGQPSGCCSGQSIPATNRPRAKKEARGF
jgi:hypothetical protein